MSRFFNPSLILVPWLAVGCASHPAESQQDIREVRLESEVFDNIRTLRVWLPPDYEKSVTTGHRYPVLYMNDGQNLFDSSTAVLNDAEWQVDETVGALVRGGSIEPIVVVGIDNAGRRGRAREYLPYPDRFLNPPEPDPQGHRYAEFLRGEVIPTIEDRFRVSRRREDRALGGSSYGALSALHVATADPTLFGKLLLESPSFYVDDRHIFRDVRASHPAAERIYMGVGTNELAIEGCDEDREGNREAVRDVERMQALLEEKAEDRGTRIAVTVEECAIHHEEAWARRLPDALEFLFGR